MSKFTEAELEYLKMQWTGRLATVNKLGEPQNTPVTFRYNAELDTIDIGGPNNSKPQNSTRRRTPAQCNPLLETRIGLRLASRHRPAYYRK